MRGTGAVLGLASSAAPGYTLVLATGDGVSALGLDGMKG